jgi:putative RNA 2'-phosphotransferase
MEEIRVCPNHGFYRGELCSCGYKGEQILSKERVEKLGRFISGLLRHFPDKFNLEMDEDGWVDFNSLVRVVTKKYRWANQWLVMAIVSSDQKNRYEIREGKIRARYGHSVSVKLSDYPDSDEDVLFYGTGEEEAQRIMEIGIKPVNQTFVHLSTTVEKSETVARFRTDSPVILEIDAKKARRDGIKLIKANDYIVLTEKVPPEYITRAVKL